jgi:hypothetical protein
MLADGRSGIERLGFVGALDDGPFARRSAVMSP